MQYLVLLRSVNADVLCSAKIANLRIECSQLRHLNECPKPLFLNDVVCDGKLIVGGLLGKYRSPCVETVNALLLQGLRAQVFE